MYFDNNSLIGTIRSTRFPYYDSKTKGMKFKSRPILILSAESEIGKADLTVIPVSKISDKTRIIKDYDIELSKELYPLLKLKEDISYLRTSKITTINLGEVSKTEISNLKIHYPQLFEDVVNKLKQFVNKL